MKESRGEVDGDPAAQAFVKDKDLFEIANQRKGCSE